MIRIVVIGTGNLGTQLCSAFEKSKNCTLVGYLNHSNRSLDTLQAPLVKSLGTLPVCDLILLCTPDDTIATISNEIKTNAIVAHTSGSVSLEAVSNHKNHGVFYLPQSFSKSRTARFEEITICLEASSSKVMEQLEFVGSSLSRKRKHLNSSQRKYLHLAAVYANNFVNHCYLKTQQVLEKEHLELELLEPLMKETLLKAIEMGPYSAQTGPAKRADLTTLETHKNMLDATELDMYQAITQSILKTYGTEL